MLFKAARSAGTFKTDFKRVSKISPLDQQTHLRVTQWVTFAEDWFCKFDIGSFYAAMLALFPSGMQRVSLSQISWEDRNLNLFVWLGLSLFKSTPYFLAFINNLISP